MRMASSRSFSITFSSLIISFENKNALFEGQLVNVDQERPNRKLLLHYTKTVNEEY